MGENIIEMQHIVKSYGSNEVLHGVDFSLKKGSIHALLGENGTGKSTLMNVLAGVIPGNAGTVSVNGKNYTLSNSYIPVSEDIAFIHQELALINDLNVFENMFLGKELKNGIKLNKKEMARRTKDLLDTMNISLSPYAMVRDLNASYKQIVEIARALMFQAKVIIMDEPTTALTNVEIEHVFQLMSDLKKKGISFIFISHKLNEVTKICDSYTIMRDGVVVDTGDMTADVTEEYMAKQMVGRTLDYSDLYKERKIGEEILRTEHLSKDRAFNDVNISVRKGEIIGITGLLGDGRYEVANTIYGNNAGYDGKIYIRGREVPLKTIQKARSQGISYLPRNRKENGILKDLDIRENLTVSIQGRLRRAGLFIDHKKEEQVVNEYTRQLNIKRGSMKENIRSLSGGNQQKVILARSLSSDPGLVILDNPTQGVDVGAKLEIYHIIYDLAERGVSFLVLSGEAQEVLKLCDRIYVMFHGEVRKELLRNEADEEKIMIAATGGKV